VTEPSVAEGRWAWADVDLDALEHNVRALRHVVAPAALWAVVKADAYGHGAVPCARAALAAGAEGLCVALVQEGLELRGAGIGAPILLLTGQPAAQAAAIVSARLTPTVCSLDQVAALARAGADDLGVHLKIDTGMRRVGCDPGDAVAVADAIATARGALRLAGVWTHLAVADEPADPFTALQLERFDAALADLAAAGHRPALVHAANSAGALAHPAARRDLVRVGIAMYGISPGHGVDHLVHGLQPVLSLRSRVSFVKRVAAGEGISYGLRHRFDAPTTVATLPIGYADGVARRLSAAGGEVLVGGRRCPIVGVVTMDQLMVDVGNATVAVGDEVVLLGTQGAESVTADEWGDLLGTIGYEVTCGISARVERRHRGRGAG
jgi:alanine racemase